MNRKTISGDRRRRKMITMLWALGVSAVVITLIYLEKSAILYILSTVSIAILLMIVALADLAHGDAKSQQMVQSGDVPNREV